MSCSSTGFPQPNLTTVLDLASQKQSNSLYLTLIQLLFSYAYESRTTQLDPSPESAWTLCILTPPFSALVSSTSTCNDFHTQDLKPILVSSYRRALAFPLYRSWELVDQCKKDVADLLSQGKRAVTRALLWIKNLLDHHEVYYVYSKVWVNDFCVWIQAYAVYVIQA